MVNKRRLIKLTRELIRINSENPGGSEFRIARFVKNYLLGVGVKARIYEFKKGRSNVVAILGGKNKKHFLLITPHLDTVPKGKSWNFSPFLGTIKGGRIYGLGATDCKGNLACALEAINSLLEDNIVLDYNLIFAATADEESGSTWGLIPLLKKRILQPDAAVVLDSDDFDIVITQKGLIHLKVKIQGKRAHGAYPWRGINAILISLDIINDLRKCPLDYSRNKYLRSPTMNIGTIRGGDKVNIVADWCEFELDFRFLPGMPPEKILKEIRKIIGRHAQKFFRRRSIPQDGIKIEIEGIQKPYQIEKEHPLVNSLIRAMRKINVRPIVKGSEGATVMTFFQDKNIPAVATGFGSAGCAHIADEYVKIDNLYKGALVLAEFLKGYKFS
jgi:succinyl-diaminopimelate desuccinylase